MRKFMKFCGMAALIMLVIGLLLVAVVKFTKGTEYMNEFLNDITGGWFGAWAEDVEHRHDDGERLYADAPVDSERSSADAPAGDGREAGTNEDHGGELIDNIVEGGQELINDISEGYESFKGYQIEDSTTFNKNYPVESGDVEHVIELTADSLNVEVGACAMEILPAEDGICRISTQNVGKFQVYQRGEELYIKGTRKAKEDASQCRIYLYLPEGCYWREADIELGAGSIYAEGLNAGKLELEVGAGKIDIDGVNADSLEISVGAGEVALNQMNVRKLELEVSMGNISADGTVLGNIEAECSMGNIELYLSGSQEAFNYQLECMAGNILLDGQDYGKGITQAQKINNGADKRMELECSMGNITVDFEN